MAEHMCGRLAGYPEKGYSVKGRKVPVDNCTHIFAELAAHVLPEHYKRLKHAMAASIPAERLVGYKSATREALAKLSRSVDFPGCYVFLDNNKAVYVGISRSVVKRIIQHLNYDSHYSASLIYRMASEDYPHEMKRDQAMKDEQFRSVFFAAQDRLRRMSIAFVEIDNDLELYLFEVYASMELDTDTWNTFRTH
jgi:hypothetical protein